MEIPLRCACGMGCSPRQLNKLSLDGDSAALRLRNEVSPTCQLNKLSLDGDSAALRLRNGVFPLPT